MSLNTELPPSYKIMKQHQAEMPLSKIPTWTPGFANWTPAQQIVFAIYKDIIQSDYELHGFLALDLPPFVDIRHLVAKGGAEKQIYTVAYLQNKKITKNGLAFDRTIPLALYVLTHMTEIVFPLKRSDISLSYRAELKSTNTGRLLGFYQADVDIVGRNLPLTCDAECITTLVSALSKLKIPAFFVHINHLEIPKELLKEAGFKKGLEALRIIDKLDKTPKEEIAKELTELEPEIPVSTIKELVDICSFNGSIDDFLNSKKLGEASQKYFNELKEALKFIRLSGVDTSLFKFTPGVTRGLDYYTGIVFETFFKDFPQFGSICSGGRYDNLVDVFAEQETGIQGVGGSIGLSRLFQILVHQGKIPNNVKIAAQVVILTRTRELFAVGVEIATRLREENIKTEMYTGEATNITKQLDYVNKTGAPFAIMVMGEKNYVIRDMSAKQQTDDISSQCELVKKAKKIFKERIRGLSIYTLLDKGKTIDIGHTRIFTIEDFYDSVWGGKPISLNPLSAERLDECREFVAELLKKNVPVYGLTTGFGDLRSKSVLPKDAATLSSNIMLSHDAGIGKPLPLDIVKGAMILRANSLSKGNSAFDQKSLETLIAMINANIIPEIPSIGSLGASGDLALLARLGRAMQGHKDVKVYYKGELTNAKEALEKAGIAPFIPAAKEGLALTNGTSFMGAMMATAYLKQLQLYENIFALLNLYLNATESVDVAFSSSMQEVRKQEGQTLTAEILRDLLKDSPFINHEKIQDDYSQRCLPSILGPKIEDFLKLSDRVFNELDAVTDNPLIFSKDEISKDIAPSRIIEFKDSPWTVISGGNFHGEVIATAADELVNFNAKIALTLERHTTFLNNPKRNDDQFNTYLIVDKAQAGLKSGFMILQYTANALTQKICALANPVGNFNLTSANESEDIVSYGTSAAQKLLEQLELMQLLTTVYLTMVAQAYSITKEKIEKETKIDPNLTSEKLFAEVQTLVKFPIKEEVSFDEIYDKLKSLLVTDKFRKIIGGPLSNKLGISIKAIP